MKGYHFNDGKTLRDGRRLPEIGERLTHEGPVIPCESGLHFSEHPFDALGYAQGSCLDLIEGPDDAIAHGDPVDKFVGAWRVRIATIDVTPVLREFACRCALDVANYWDMPDVVRAYLDGTDRSDAARAAASASARDSTKEAAAASAFAVASAFASAFAWDSAWDSARDSQRKLFAEMVDAAFADNETGV